MMLHFLLLLVPAILPLYDAVGIEEELSLDEGISADSGPIRVSTVTESQARAVRGSHLQEVDKEVLDGANTPAAASLSKEEVEKKRREDTAELFSRALDDPACGVYELDFTRMQLIAQYAPRDKGEKTFTGRYLDAGERERFMGLYMKNQEIRTGAMFKGPFREQLAAGTPGAVATGAATATVTEPDKASYSVTEVNSVSEVGKPWTWLPTKRVVGVWPLQDGKPTMRILLLGQPFEIKKYNPKAVKIGEAFPVLRGPGQEKENAKSAEMLHDYMKQVDMAARAFVQARIEGRCPPVKLPVHEKRTRFMKLLDSCENVALWDISMMQSFSVPAPLGGKELVTTKEALKMQSGKPKDDSDGAKNKKNKDSQKKEGENGEDGGSVTGEKPRLWQSLTEDETEMYFENWWSVQTRTFFTGWPAERVSEVNTPPESEISGFFFPGGGKGMYATEGNSLHRVLIMGDKPIRVEKVNEEGETISTAFPATDSESREAALKYFNAVRRGASNFNTAYETGFCQPASKEVIGWSVHKNSWGVVYIVLGASWGVTLLILLFLMYCVEGDGAVEKVVHHAQHHAHQGPVQHHPVRAGHQGHHEEPGSPVSPVSPASPVVNQDSGIPTHSPITGAQPAEAMPGPSY